MQKTVKFARFVILMMCLPEEGRFVFVQDYGSLEEALAKADRNAGQLVFEIPDEARLPSGNNFEFDSGKAEVRAKLMKKGMS